MKRSERNKVKTEPQQRHPEPNNQGTDNHERHISGGINVRGEIETKRPPDLAQEHAAERKEDNAQERKKYVVEIITLISVLVVALLTALQACYTREAVNNSEIQFHSDQRPILWITNDLGMPVSCGTAGQVCWNWQYQNYGKTPAHEVKFYQFIQIGDGPWVRSFSSHEGPDLGAPIPPGKIDNDSIVSDPATRVDIDKSRTIDHYIRIKVRIEYRDAYGASYESGFCYGTLVAGWPKTMNYCPPPDNYIH